MLKLRDFVHLPQLVSLVEQLVADKAGLIVVAGLDPRPQTSPTWGDVFLPSGRSTMLGILASEILTAHPSAHAVVVTRDRATWRIPRNLHRRVRTLFVGPSSTYAERIAEAVRRRTDLLVIDRLNAETTPAAFESVWQGQRVLSQVDTVLRGAEVIRQLLDLGVPPERLDCLTWVLSVQRLPTLCPYCKRPVQPEPAQLERLRCLYPHLDHLIQELISQSLVSPPHESPSREETRFYRADGCPRCQDTGRPGDVAAFDLFRAEPGAAKSVEQLSLLSLEAYMLHLAARGYLPLEDVLRLETDQLRRTYNLLVASEHAASETDAKLRSQSIELTVANRVLQQRTEALISLHDVGQALVQITDIRGLANRICRHTCNLCGADRAILYLLRSEGTAEVLAARGWDPAHVPQRLEAAQMFDAVADAGSEPRPYPRWPPGITPRHPDIEGAALWAGLRVPLIAQGKVVGFMIVHSTRRRDFTPGEVALLQTFANQAAVAIENAHLFDDLQRSLRETSKIKSYMEDVFASVDSGILTTDLAGIVTTCNRAAGEIWRVPVTAIPGQPIAELFDEKQAGEILALFAEALEREISLHDYELACTLSQRGQVTLKLQITPLKDAQDRRIGVTVVVEDLTEERRLRQTLNRYLAPSVVEEALRMAMTGQFPLGGTHRVMTVLFADIRGFTSFSERVSPEELVDVLNRYLTVAARAILEQGGTLDKFMGDAVMALFNAPVPQSDHALRAVRAAWDMQQCIATLDGKGPCFRFGVGIHMGEAVAGNIGSPERLDYTAIGDSVNLARRLEEIATGGQILLSEAAYRAVAPWVDVHRCGPIVVKGREEPVHVYELLALNTTPNHAET